MGGGGGESEYGLGWSVQDEHGHGSEVEVVVDDIYIDVAYLITPDATTYGHQRLTTDVLPPRDIKPPNVLLMSDKHRSAKLGDFGSR